MKNIWTWFERYGQVGDVFHSGSNFIERKIIMQPYYPYPDLGPFGRKPWESIINPKPYPFGGPYIPEPKPTIPFPYIPHPDIINIRDRVVVYQ